MASTLANLDSRIVYFLVFVLVVGPLISPIGLSIAVSPDTEEYHSVIASLGPEDIVLLHLGTEYSGWNELAAGTTATVRLIVERGSKLAIIASHPEAVSIPDLIYAAVRTEAEANDWKYGEDTLNLGYVFPNEAAVASAAQDFHGLVRDDYAGRSIEGTFLDDITDGSDWSLIIDIQTGIWSEAMVSHFHVSYGTNMAKHCIGVSVPGAKAQLEAGMLVGLLASLRGGAEMETLIGAPGPGVAAMDAFSLVHYMVLVAVVVGNIGYFGSGQQR
jgi:hypothetical protein